MKLDSNLNQIFPFEFNIIHFFGETYDLRVHQNIITAKSCDT
jgi:hypothetical protein